MISKIARYHKITTPHFSSGINAGVVAGSNGVGVTAGGNTGRGNSDGTSVTHTNAILGSATGTTTTRSGGNLNLIGGELRGNSIAFEATNLTITSLQDTATYDSEQRNISGSITAGTGVSVSGSYTASNINANYASVNNQSGIFAGDGGYQGTIQGRSSLEGALITSTQTAEDAGRNRFSTATLTTQDIQNISEYSGTSIAISAGANYNNPNTQDPATTSITKSAGYGNEGDTQSSTTHSGINTQNITITNQAAQAATGVNTQDILNQVHSTTTTEQAQANSGALTNTFDAEEVQHELDVSTRVTQTFDTNRQEIKAELNTRIDEAREIIEDETGTYSSQQIAEAHDTIEETQHLGVLVDSITGALYSPSESVLGTVANTLNPLIAYEIGQYFKENELANSIDGANRAEEGSPQHILAQTLLAGLTANLAGNDALSAALAAGGSEALAPALGRLLYGTQDTNEPELSELDTGQKETISAILSLGSLGATLATTGNTTDAVASGVSSSVAVEENALAGTPYWTLQDVDRAIALQGGTLEEKIRALIETGRTQEEIKELLKDDPDFNDFTAYGEEGFDTLYGVQKNKVDALNKLVDDTIVTLEVAGIATLFIDGVAVKTTDMAAKKLIQEAIEQGIKISPEKIVSIAKVDGKVVFLETGYQVGDKGAGLEHILQPKRVQEFLNQGIAKNEIAPLIMEAVTNGKVITTTGTGKNIRNVYEVYFHGKIQKVAVGVSDNGFIVTAHPF